MRRIVVLIFTVGAGVCLAQADRASITGTITDESHAAMSAAHVAVVYPATALRRETQSSSSGAYEIAGLPIRSDTSDQPGARLARESGAE
jgi:Carboxypeptidase regulatory-like domain